MSIIALVGCCKIGAQYIAPYHLPLKTLIAGVEATSIVCQSKWPTHYATAKTWQKVADCASDILLYAGFFVPKTPLSGFSVLVNHMDLYTSQAWPSVHPTLFGNLGRKFFASCVLGMSLSSFAAKIHTLVSKYFIHQNPETLPKIPEDLPQLTVQWICPPEEVNAQSKFIVDILTHLALLYFTTSPGWVIATIGFKSVSLLASMRIQRIEVREEFSPSIPQDYPADGPLQKIHKAALSLTFPWPIQHRVAVEGEATEENPNKTIQESSQCVAAESDVFHAIAMQWQRAQEPGEIQIQDRIPWIGSAYWNLECDLRRLCPRSLASSKRAQFRILIKDTEFPEFGWISAHLRHVRKKT